MTSAPGRGYGRIPYGRGLYGRAMTVEGDNEAEIVPLDLDTDLPAGEGSSGVSAEVVALDLDVEMGEGIGITPPNVPIKAGRTR